MSCVKAHVLGASAKAINFEVGGVTMGYISHNAIVVTSSDQTILAKVMAWAIDLKMAVSGVVTSPMNGYRSFLVAPDGSKEGWHDSDLGDQRREALIAYFKTLRYADGSSSLEWAEVDYGSDDNTALIAHHEWEDAQ